MILLILLILLVLSILLIDLVVLVDLLDLVDLTTWVLTDGLAYLLTDVLKITMISIIYLLVDICHNSSIIMSLHCVIAAISQ